MKAHRNTVDARFGAMTAIKFLWRTVVLWAAAASVAAPASLDASRSRRRILLVSAPSPNDRMAIAQRRIVAGWSAGAADRDLSLVEVFPAHVSGASDGAASLRRRYHLAPGAFQALLIGKDGHVALRSARPIPAVTLQGAIDAMPMRRAGQR